MNIFTLSLLSILVLITFVQAKRKSQSQWNLKRDPLPVTAKYPRFNYNQYSNSEKQAIFSKLFFEHLNRTPQSLSESEWLLLKKANYHTRVLYSSFLHYFLRACSIENPNVPPQKPTSCFGSIKLKATANPKRSFSKPVKVEKSSKQLSFSAMIKSMHIALLATFAFSVLLCFVFFFLLQYS